MATTSRLMVLLLSGGALLTTACQVSAPAPEAPAEDLVKAREEAATHLKGYAKLKDGKVRLPIARAKALLAKEGLQPVVIEKKVEITADAMAAAAAKLDTLKATPMEAFVVDAAKAAKGKDLFASKTCSACHSIDGSKLVGPSLKGFWGSARLTTKLEPVRGDLAYFMESVKTPNAKIVNTFPPAMPPLGLTDEEIDLVLHYVNSL